MPSKLLLTLKIDPVAIFGDFAGKTAMIFAVGVGAIKRTEFGVINIAVSHASTPSMTSRDA